MGVPFIVVETSCDRGIGEAREDETEEEAEDEDEDEEMLARSTEAGMMIAVFGCAEVNEAEILPGNCATDGEITEFEVFEALLLFVLFI